MQQGMDDLDKCEVLNADVDAAHATCSQVGSLVLLGF